MLNLELSIRSSLNLIPVALGKTQMTVEPPYWNHPRSSPLAILSPGFLVQPILPTSNAGVTSYPPRIPCLPPIATKAIGTASRPGPRSAWMSITDRLFIVNTSRSGVSVECGYKRTFVDGLWIDGCCQGCLQAMESSTHCIARLELASPRAFESHSPLMSFTLTTSPWTGAWKRW